jgi:hypothetical protein
MPPAEPDMRGVGRGLSDASDTKLLKAVAVVDLLAERGVLDELIAPVRPRLTKLRPARALKVGRLLFLPLDPLIVPAQRWKQEQPTIPRTSLVSISETIRARMAPLYQEVSAVIQGHSVRDAAVVARAGALLWPAAGRDLLTAPEPVNWRRTGLPEHVYPPLARRIGTILEQYAAIDTLVADASGPLSQPGVDAFLPVLTATADRNPDALPMMMTLLMARLPGASIVLLRAAASLAHHGRTMLRLAGEQAAEVLLDQLESPDAMASELATGGAPQAGAMARRLASLLHALEQEAVTSGRRDRVRQARYRLGTACREYFTSGMQEQVLSPLQHLVKAGVPASTSQIEAAARGLRELESEGRTLGGAEQYDDLLRQAAETVRALPADGALDLVKQSRLLEIVSSPEEALALLHRA